MDKKTSESLQKNQDNTPANFREELADGLQYLTENDQLFLLDLIRKLKAGKISQKEFSEELEKRKLEELEKSRSL